MKRVNIDRQTVSELDLINSVRRIRPLRRRIIGVARYAGDRRLINDRPTTASCER